MQQTMGPSGGVVGETMSVGSCWPGSGGIGIPIGAPAAIAPSAAASGGGRTPMPAPRLPNIAGGGPRGIALAEVPTMEQTSGM